MCFEIIISITHYVAAKKTRSPHWFWLVHHPCKAMGSQLVAFR